VAAAVNARMRSLAKSTIFDVLVRVTGE
jgi:hypothetical protein